MMKAWRVEDLDSCESYVTVVFAETRSQAKLNALATDTCEDAEYIRIRATRVKELDSAYKGKPEMDWYDPEDRLLMVRELGMYCYEPDYEVECPRCSAREECGQYIDWTNERDLQFGWRK